MTGPHVSPSPQQGPGRAPVRGRIPARFAPVLFGGLLSGLMTLVVSGIATARAVGLPPDFIATWLSAFAGSWVVTFPTVLVVAPLVRRLVARLTVPGPGAVPLSPGARSGG